MPESAFDPREAQIESLRLPPHSIEAEQAVLGGLMLLNSAWERVGDLISLRDFYRSDHRLLWSVIVQLIEENKPADVLSVHAELQRQEKAKEVGGLAFLNQLVSGTPSASNIQHYAEIVRERAQRRQLIEAATVVLDEAYAPHGTKTSDLIHQAEAAMLAVGSKQVGKGPRKMSAILADVMVDLDERQKNPATVTGVATGFVDLDEMTTGLQPGDLVIVAGRPAMGKTAFSLNIAEHVAVELQLPVLIFSLEMGDKQLGQRLLSSVGKVDSQKLRRGRLEAHDWDRLGVALGHLNDAPIRIDESASLGVADLRARARRIAREVGGMGLILVDYLQLMQLPTDGDNTRASQIGDITRSLKQLAKELACPVMLLSQLNRALEQRSNRRPVMSDLRDSGSIESDADTICFIYRDEVYHEDSPDKGIAEIIIGKQRNGPIGTVKLTFLGRHTRFENYAGAPGYDTPRQEWTPKRPPPQRSFADSDK